MRDVNGRLQKMQGFTVMLTIDQSATAADILQAGITKLEAMDWDMVTDVSYVLLLSTYRQQ